MCSGNNQSSLLPFPQFLFEFSILLCNLDFMKRGSIKIGFCEDEDVSLDVTCEVRLEMTKIRECRCSTYHSKEGSQITRDKRLRNL